MRSLPGLEFRIRDLQFSVHAGPFLTQNGGPCVWLISYGKDEAQNCPEKEPCQNKVLRPQLSGPLLFIQQTFC